MTPLRKRMLEELQRRNYSVNTIRPYLYAVEDFARYFGKSPDKLRQEDVRQYQLHLLNERKLTIETIAGRISAIRFFFLPVDALSACRTSPFRVVMYPVVEPHQVPKTAFGLDPDSWKKPHRAVRAHFGRVMLQPIVRCCGSGRSPATNSATSD